MNPCLPSQRPYGTQRRGAGLTATAMGMGQAAGVAAALAARGDASIRGVSVAELHDRLVTQGAILSLADPAVV